jgi:hypothetical protein
MAVNSNVRHRTIDGAFLAKMVNRGTQRYYIQSALSVSDSEKRAQEINSLIRIPDSFRKIVVVGNRINPWKDENGILYIGIEQFLLDEKMIDM